MTSSFRAPGFAILFAAAFGALAAKPTPTPTPASPRLTGGFGKTPAASASRASEKKKVRITNESLTTEPDKGKVTTSSRPAPTPREPGAGESPAASAESGPGADELYWRGETRRLRDRVAELKDLIVRLQDESQKLENDFYAWDDGAYRDRVIKPAWDKAREDLVTARRELPIAEKELADLPDRARKAGAMPGWLRE